MTLPIPSHSTFCRNGDDNQSCRTCPASYPLLTLLFYTQRRRLARSRDEALAFAARLVRLADRTRSAEGVKDARRGLAVGVAGEAGGSNLNRAVVVGIFNLQISAMLEEERHHILKTCAATIRRIGVLLSQRSRRSRYDQRRQQQVLACTPRPSHTQRHSHTRVRAHTQPHTHIHTRVKLTLTFLDGSVKRRGAGGVRDVGIGAGVEEKGNGFGPTEAVKERPAIVANHRVDLGATLDQNPGQLKVLGAGQQQRRLLTGPVDGSPKGDQTPGNLADGTVVIHRPRQLTHGRRPFGGGQLHTVKAVVKVACKTKQGGRGAMKTGGQ